VIVVLSARYSARPGDAEARIVGRTADERSDAGNLPPAQYGSRQQSAATHGGQVVDVVEHEHVAAVVARRPVIRLPGVLVGADEVGVARSRCQVLAPGVSEAQDQVAYPLIGGDLQGVVIAGRRSFVQVDIADSAIGPQELGEQSRGARGAAGGQGRVLILRQERGPVGHIVQVAVVLQMPGEVADISKVDR
jgi:hypothetical protein